MYVNKLNLVKLFSSKCDTFREALPRLDNYRVRALKRPSIGELHGDEPEERLVRFRYSLNITFATCI